MGNTTETDYSPVLKYCDASRFPAATLTSSPPSSPPLAAALSSLQLPLSLYLLTHVSRGEVVTQHEGVASSVASFKCFIKDRKFLSA